MIKFFRILFKLDPPMNKWINYGEYQIRWRKRFSHLVKIVDYNKEKELIKLAPLTLKEQIEAELRDI